VAQIPKKKERKKCWGAARVTNAKDNREVSTFGREQVPITPPQREMTHKREKGPEGKEEKKRAQRPHNTNEVRSNKK